MFLVSFQEHLEKWPFFIGDGKRRMVVDSVENWITTY